MPGLPRPRDLMRRYLRPRRDFERELLVLVLERCGTPIVAFDRRAAVTHASKGARALFGEASAVGASPREWIELLEPRTGDGLPLAVCDLPQVRAAGGRAAPTFDLLVETDLGPRTLRALVQRLESSRRATDAAVAVHFQAVTRSRRGS